MRLLLATLLAGSFVTPASSATFGFGSYAKTEVYKSQWDEAAAADKVRLFAIGVCDKKSHSFRALFSVQATTLLMCGIVCLSKGDTVCGGFRFVEADEECFTGKEKTGDAAGDKQFVYKMVPKTK